MLKRNILAVIGATAWIGASEFARNQLLFKSYWVEHYAKLGLVFPEKPVNGALWGLWSLLFAVTIFMLAKKFTLLQTVALAWFIGFVLMWVVQRMQNPRITPQQRQRAMQLLEQAKQRMPSGLNENYARELMELHPLGVDAGYTQQDVVEVARILTGWTIDRPQQGGGFVFREPWHEPGSKTVLGKGLDSGTAFEILSIDIADVDVGKNIGAELQTDQAEADKRIAQAKAEERRALAVAMETEYKAETQRQRAKLVEAEAMIPMAIAEAFRSGHLGIMNYQRIKNIEADTGMRNAIASGDAGTGKES